MMLPTLPLSWVWPTGPQFAGLVAMGLASGACPYLTVRALYHADAARLAPVNHTKMLWALVIGFVWFGEVPTPWVLVGTAVVMASTSIAVRGGGRRRPRVRPGSTSTP